MANQRSQYFDTFTRVFLYSTEHHNPRRSKNKTRTTKKLYRQRWDYMIFAIKLFLYIKIWKVMSFVVPTFLFWIVHICMYVHNNTDIQQGNLNIGNIRNIHVTTFIFFFPRKLLRETLWSLNLVKVDCYFTIFFFIFQSNAIISCSW